MDFGCLGVVGRANLACWGIEKVIGSQLPQGGYTTNAAGETIPATIAYSTHGKGGTMVCEEMAVRVLH